MVVAGAGTKTKYRIAKRFSNLFEINKRQSELDFVDILIDTDIRLYIDPFALSVEDDDWSMECNDLVVGFFQNLVDSIRGGNLSRARDLLSNLHEPNQTRLGLSSMRPRGRGVGHRQSRDVYQAFANSKAIESGLLKDLSDCELFIDGIGHDKISDMTTNVIRRKLIDFTKEQCQKWFVPMQHSPTGPWWDQDRKLWRSSYDYLPVYRGEPLILVPKRSVRYVMAIDDRKFYEMEVIEFIRQHFNRAECLNATSSLFQLLRMGLRVTKKDVTEEFPKSKDFLRHFAETFPDVLDKYKKTAKRLARCGKAMPTDAGIYNLEMLTAHSQGLVLIEEVNIHMNITNTVSGDNFGSVGQGNRTVLKDVTIYKSDVDASSTITTETKNLLKQSYDVIEAALVSDDDKNDAKENLQRLTDELEGEKDPSRIARFIIRLGQVVPSAAAILKSGQEIANIVGRLPNPFGG
jgi:hypothetical protein